MAGKLGSPQRTAPAASVIPVIWTEAALSDLERIRAYIGHFNPIAARRMASRLLEAVNGLTMFPERGRPIGQGRREVVSVWPYLIRYRIVDDKVVILRVRHGAQA